MSLKFSVLVPVYNVENYISECIESVLKQTYTHFELLLVDDGTPDNSGVICEEYARIDSRVKVFHIENKGPLHARRYAIERASGDYYVFLDSDDTIKRNALEIINEKIQRYDCDCLIFGLEKKEEGKVIAQVYDHNEEALCHKDEIYRKVFFSTDYNSLCRKAVKANIFRDVDYSSFYHLNYTEDLLQSLEIYKYSKKIAFISNILYEYRMNQASITHGSTRMVVDYTIRKKVFEFLIDESVFSEDEFDRYRDFCIDMIIGDIIRFSILRESCRFIKEKINEIRDDTYYQEYLSEGISYYRDMGFKTIIFYMFKHKIDIPMICTIKIAHYIKTILYGNRILKNR